MLLPTQDDSRLMILVRVSTAPHRLFLLLLTTSVTELRSLAAYTSIEIQMYEYAMPSSGATGAVP